MTKRKNTVILAVFFVLLFGLSLLNLAMGDRTFSEQENRYLQKAPAFSWSSLVSGKFTRQANDYASDQFPFRETWIAVKARSELWMGKLENNGVFLCDSDTLLRPFEAPKAKKISAKIKTLNKFAAGVDVPVCLALIPTASEIYRDMLPDGVQNDSQTGIIDTVYGKFEGVCANLLPAFRAHRDEYIFYRTDHHWTSLGAYYAYRALGEALGYTPNPREAYDVKTVSDAFFGTSYSASGFFWLNTPDTMQTFADSPDGLRVRRVETRELEDGSLYVPPMLETKDKYRFFLGGNTPLAVIETGNREMPRLLMVRDSYSDSLAPFLLDHFSEIHLIDLRYFTDSVSDYARENRIDEILVIYSVPNFSTENLGILR